MCGSLVEMNLLKATSFVIWFRSRTSSQGAQDVSVHQGLLGAALSLHLDIAYLESFMKLHEPNRVVASPGQQSYILYLITYLVQDDRVPSKHVLECLQPMHDRKVCTFEGT